MTTECGTLYLAKILAERLACPVNSRRWMKDSDELIFVWRDKVRKSGETNRDIRIQQIRSFLPNKSLLRIHAKTLPTFTPYAENYMGQFGYFFIERLSDRIEFGELSNAVKGNVPTPNRLAFIDDKIFYFPNQSDIQNNWEIR